MIEIDLQLGFRNNCWIAQNEQFRFVSDEISDLDNQLNEFIIKNYQKGKFKIRFYFDFDNFPVWMRQYMPHYFNREKVFCINQD